MIHFLPQTSSFLPSSLLPLILIFGFIIPSRCQLSYSHYCPPVSNNDTAYSHLDSDVNFLLESLSSKASNHTFYNDSFNGIYGLFLCRGDLSSQECHICVGDVSKRIKLDCPSRTMGIIWFDMCMLRYSVENFFGTQASAPWTLLYNPENVSSIAYRDSTDLSLLYGLTNDAAKAESMFKGGNLIQTGDYQRYGAAQCTRDITNHDCDKCLTNLVEHAKECCLQQRGYRVSAPRQSLSLRHRDLPLHPFLYPSCLLMKKVRPRIF